MSRFTFAGFIAIAVILTGVVASDAATSIPFTFVDNRMTIQCTINGTGPFTMIVDTGSPDTVIDRSAAKLLGLRVSNGGTTTGAGNKPVHIGSTEVRSLALGSQLFQKVPASVIDLSEIRTKLEFPHLDGVIGYAIMRRFAVLVDPDALTIGFLAVAPTAPSSATTTPFSGVIPRVAATIDGTQTTVIIDTGDRSSLTLFGPFAKQHKFYSKYPSRQNIVTGYGIGGPVYADVFTLPSLDIFDRHVKAVVTRASRQTGGVFAGSGQGGSIGEGVLKRFTIIYDYPRRHIIAWPSTYFAQPDRFVPPPQLPAS
jgi:hypothetical protein